MPIVKCEMCGDEFSAKYKCKRYCVVCQAKREKEQKASYRKQWKSVEKEMQMKPVKEPKRPTVSILEITRRANAEGKTYGQYVSEKGL